jgi:hypothetical protein
VFHEMFLKKDELIRDGQVLLRAVVGLILEDE